MRRLPFILLLFTAAILGIATFVEDSRGTAFIHQAVYGALWFKLLWGAVAAAALWQLWRTRLYKRVAVFVLHLSMLLILAGGLLTSLTHQSGVLHLRQGRVETQFLGNDKRLADLPFTISLDTFYIQHYPGTEAPQDYVSVVRVGNSAAEAVPVTISMNRIHQRSGYRLYQSSYDPDGLGSWLTVTFDPYGSAVAYLGFLLFGLSGIAVLLGRSGGFRRLLRQFRHQERALLLLTMVLMWPMATTAATGADTNSAHDSQSAIVNLQSQQIPCVSRASADSLSTRLVVWNDRVCPFNTLATDFVKKLYGKARCKGYTPEQVVASWQRYPEVWCRAPLIKVKSAELRRRLGLNSTHCSFASLYDAEGNYRLQPLWEAETDKHSKLAQAIQQTDEKAGLVAMLLGGTLVQEAPAGVSVSPLRIRAELMYNRVPFVSILFMANLTVGMLLMAWLVAGIVRARRERGNEASRENRDALSPAIRHSSFVIRHSSFIIHHSSFIIRHSSFVIRHSSFLLLLLSLLALLFAYALRWYVSGRVPLSNGFETMMFAAIAVQGMALWLIRRVPETAPFGFLLAGFLLLVAHLGYMNPQITNLMPVLNSPWLSSHVSIIMISYALLGFTFMNALVGVWLPEADERSQQLTLLSRLLLYPAVLLLFVGIFLGSVWANVSWGTYWSWDPKEVWALITAIVYAVPLHVQSLPRFSRPRVFHAYMLMAFLTVLMTYFGVNFVLGGMHSYAN